VIVQLLTELQAAEKIAVAAVGAAEAAYNAAVKSHASVGQTAALDPGRHQVALGAIRTAIAHVETIMGAAADAQEAMQKPEARSQKPEASAGAGAASPATTVK
jgi:hypothetical protein